MRMTLGLVTAVALLGGPALAGTPVKGEWTGFITDTHCGAKGASKDHTARCVEKCMKMGSKAQIMSEADQVIYDLDRFDTVKKLVGTRVTLKGTLNPYTKTIAVESAAKAATK